MWRIEMRRIERPLDIDRGNVYDRDVEEKVCKAQSIVGKKCAQSRCGEKGVCCGGR